MHKVSATLKKITGFLLNSVWCLPLKKKNLEIESLKEDLSLSRMWGKKYREESQQLKKDLLKSQLRAVRKQAKQKSPSNVIEDVLERGIKWYDYYGLEDDKKKNYYREVQRALMNTALQNEINKYIADLVHEIAYSDADANRDKILRYSINGIKAVMERLESYPNPEQKEEVSNVHDVI